MKAADADGATAGFALAVSPFRNLAKCALDHEEDTAVSFMKVNRNVVRNIDRCGICFIRYGNDVGLLMTKFVRLIQNRTLL
jgi:hypothetical protein